MKNAKLTALTIERFKSFKDSTRLEFAPLTIILGRNNSGKSTLIQSLLLLKQTLADPRADVMLKLEGVVEAFNLRELTFGWPAALSRVDGPQITLEWECDVDIEAALSEAQSPDLVNLVRHTGLTWLSSGSPEKRKLRTSVWLKSVEIEGVTKIAELRICSIDDSSRNVVHLSDVDGRWICKWDGVEATGIAVEFDHFVPYLTIDRRRVGPRDRQRAWHNAYLVLFAQPLEALKALLGTMHYLGSGRQTPPSLFKSATTAPSEIGVSGEYAAQILHRRQREIVHFLPPLEIENGVISATDQVLGKSLSEAVNAVMAALSVRAPVRVEEIQEVGFRLMFGDASLVHVGRGLNYLLPLVELGLFADPLRFSALPSSMSLMEYSKLCDAYAHIALEEPEAHLHPKVASRLAHYLVSLAQANRRLLVETHSDHLVRRLRGLAARAGRNSSLEKWLLENVSIISVGQDEFGNSKISSSRLTLEGGVAETWPTDFMDEATDEESAIYYAKLEKVPSTSATSDSLEILDGEEPTSEEAP